MPVGPRSLSPILPFLSSQAWYQVSGTLRKRRLWGVPSAACRLRGECLYLFNSIDVGGKGRRNLACLAFYYLMSMTMQKSKGKGEGRGDEGEEE